jgi:hypothetical protein
MFEKKRGRNQMRNLKYLTLAVISIFCLINLISFGWSAEKPKVPSSEIGVPAVPAPTKVTPSIGVTPEAKEIMPFNIKVNNQTADYLYEFSLSADLVPINDSQTAKDAISGKTVTFYVDGKFIGSGTSTNTGFVYIGISENYSRQLNLQAGTHTILAQTTHEEHVIKGSGNLTVRKASSKINIQSLMPEKSIYEAYTIGQTVTLGAILTTTLHSHPIVHVNVDCISINKMNGSTKTLKTVQTNNQGGFECPITLTQDVFDRQNCNLHFGYIGASFENQNFKKTIGERAINACPPGMHYATSCSPGCASCCQ